MCRQSNYLLLSTFKLNVKKSHLITVKICQVSLELTKIEEDENLFILMACHDHKKNMTTQKALLIALLSLNKQHFFMMMCRRT